jgi:tetratricopeptide (TPR) repeat protein
MKRFLILLFLLLSSLAISFYPRVESQMKMPGTERPVQLLAGLGNHHHAVKTASPQAQRFFDQGLRLVYAFNHEEAVRSFKRAAELDPQMAMAYWGIAYALGPNINLDVDPERERAAYEAVQKARQLSSQSPENERAYIEALAKRYSIDPKADLKRLAVDFKNAMGELVERYPDDLDAATLYAESAMNLRPWQLWKADGRPAEGTEEIIAVLESVLRRDPNHMGAIHYYIHAVEASPNPERALVYAPKLPQIAPAAGHLVHMPAHVYMRTGDYEAAARSNEDGAQADRNFFKLTGRQGMYPVMYYNHNLHFLAIAYGMEGRSGDAIRAARQLEANVAPALKEMPMLEGFMTTSTLMLVRFRRWNEIMQLPQPDPKMRGLQATWHFARGMALAATGKGAEAYEQLKLLREAREAVPKEAAFGLNSAQSILKIAENVLAAKLAFSGGQQKKAIELLREAVEMQDALAYDEPPAWFLPVRESLGGTLFINRDYAEAERVFRADLMKNPRNGRSLFGLRESLKAEGKASAASMVEAEFERAWRNADVALRVQDL